MDRTLETTRLETGQFAFDFRLIDLAERLREAAAHFRSDPEHPLVVEHCTTDDLPAISRFLHARAAELGIQVRS